MGKGAGQKVLDISTMLGWAGLLAIGYFPKLLGFLSHAYPYVWAQGMGLSFGAPKQPKTSIPWTINGPREYS
ncbi:hypothetical protein Pyn_31931 [Prunus yedoensis var. nudiflora]|uniref:Uncharacterized protein n=1 Tax=Prunus yedoensis var. nudiflora TaxID=2094558 RepID=A0A314UDG9_PRUYE|nr:hypothetical protein Pyn_31931 [Prunus yedoensis var. nudiflora]